MKYQETDRFGRITKNLRKLGFENEMEKILFDSIYAGDDKCEWLISIDLNYSGKSENNG